MTSDEIIVADLEAGIGTLTRLPEQTVDVTLVVVEPTPRSIDVAQRAIGVAAETEQGRIIVVGNKAADPADEDRLRAAFDGHELVIVPADPIIAQADRMGASPMDLDEHSPAVTTIADFASRLLN